ncbi:unnamed protein product [Pedinophyceae sp. YPF-701]|nr:unnamed protein product [Pedinophyceae sp. YPF-701]
MNVLALPARALRPAAPQRCALYRRPVPRRLDAQIVRVDPFQSLDDDESSQAPVSRSRHGKSYESQTRRRGRPAWKRKPEDTPLRDGNRDRLIGLLTLQAAKTLAYYLSETNLPVYCWFVEYMQENRIPRNGSWDEVSGEAFLRGLLSQPVQEARWKVSRDALYDNFGGASVDPRSIAQRVMDIRKVLAKEFIQDLSDIEEENNILYRETLQTSIRNSLSMSLDDVDED